jgi:nitroreductase
MNTLEAIYKLRSIRKFTNQPISEQDLNTLLKAAMMAPTARNCQEWEFVLIKNRETLKKIMQVHPHAQMLSTADCALIVCADTQREYMPGYWTGDCGAATQNILLAATELGIGSVWLGVYPNTERMKGIGNIVNLPENILPLNVIALGYPDEEKEEVNRFDPKKIHLEKW